MNKELVRIQKVIEKRFAIYLAKMEALIYEGLIKTLYLTLEITVQ